MPFYEYWVGKDINLKQLWDDYDQGSGYMDKYEAMQVHLIQFTFKEPPLQLPLFNLEKEPFTGDIDKTRGALVDIKEELGNK